MSEKWQRRIEAKLDALLEKNGLKPAEFETGQTAPRERKLTAAEKQAIANAPKTPVGGNGPVANGPRTDANNAPVTPSVPADAVGMATVETKQPDGDETVEVVPAGDVKGKK